MQLGMKTNVQLKRQENRAVLLTVGLRVQVVTLRFKTVPFTVFIFRRSVTMIRCRNTVCCLSCTSSSGKCFGGGGALPDC
jgi:hypothetical protein